MVTVPAAWLHDCVAVPKDSPLRSQGSRLAAEAAVTFLSENGYPAEHLDDVFHAIEAHSYTAAVPTRTLEAQIVQDADRLDSLGAIGIARCLLDQPSGPPITVVTPWRTRFSASGHLNRPLCDADDPFCDEREPDDSLYTIDHFYDKLFKLPDTMQTEAGRAEAHRRADLMREYLENLRTEIL